MTGISDHVGSKQFNESFGKIEEVFGCKTHLHGLEPMKVQRWFTVERSAAKWNIFRLGL